MTIHDRTFDKDRFLNPESSKNLISRLSATFSKHIFTYQAGDPSPWFIDTTLCRKSIFLRNVASLVACLYSLVSRPPRFQTLKLVQTCQALVSALVIIQVLVHAQISSSRLNLTFKQVVIISSIFLDLGRHESFLLLNILNKAVTPQYITVPVPQIYSFISLSCVI